jgi:LytS/YehU family sensor histidine kinase
VIYLSYLFIPLAFWCYHLRKEVHDYRYALAEGHQRERELVEKLADNTHGVPESLNPHFLFNSLNTIRYFVRTNAGTARELLLDLSLVLQAALRTESQVSLREELETGRAYLRLEQARVGERLEVEDSVPDAELDKLVPSRLLLPLLQALVKGITERSDGGTVSLSLQRDSLVLESNATINPPDTVPQGLHISTEPHPRIEWRLK